MLTKKDKKKRYNKKPQESIGHSFDGWGQMTKDAFKEDFGGAVSGLASAATGAINTGMEAAQLHGVDEAQAEINNHKNFQSYASDLDSLIAEQATMGNMRTDYTKKDFMQSSGDFAKGMISGALSGAGSGAAAGPWGAVAGAAGSLVSGLIGRLVANGNAKTLSTETNLLAQKSNKAAAQTTTSKAAAFDKANDARAQAAYFAEGGSINTPQFPEFPSEVTEFNTGGSHEENPYDGIPQGIAPDGLPNLVEEGEVKYDNYIFSDRLMLNKNDKKKYKFLKGKTYADAAKAIKKELGIDERPNDLIAKTDLEEHLNILSMLQEEERAKRGLRGENRMMYAKGGHLFPGDADNSTPYYGEAWYLDEGTYRETSPEVFTSGKIDPQQPKKGKFSFSSLLQAAPAIGSAIGTITSIFDKPTYEHTKRLTKPEKPVTPITYTPTHQDIRLPRLDKNFYMNKADAQAAATRRAVREQTASNPYASTLHLLVTDAQGNATRGDIRRQGEEMDINRILQEAQFNSTGKRADAEGKLKAASSNAALQDKALTRQAEKDIYAARLNMAEDQAYDAAISANTTSLFENLGAIGKEKKEFALAALKALGEGKMTPEQLAIYAKQFPEIGKYLGYKGKYGGRLRRKKGYTI